MRFYKGLKKSYLRNLLKQSLTGGSENIRLDSAQHKLIDFKIRALFAYQQQNGPLHEESKVMFRTLCLNRVDRTLDF